MKIPVNRLFFRGLTRVGAPLSLSMALVTGLVFVPNRAAATAPLPADAPGYSDLLDLFDSAPLVLRVEIRKAIPVAKDGGGAPAGQTRAYVEARVVDALHGTAPAPMLRYLADVKLDPRGRLPNLAKQQALIAARSGGAPDKEGLASLQLVAPDAQLLWGAELEARARGVLAELAAADAPGPVTGVREALFEPGTLAGAGETQVVLTTPNGAPVALSVVHVPGQETVWSVSFSEVVNGGRAPARETLAWYRLACFLPRALPLGANISVGDAAQAQAAADYRLVIAGLGPCGRTRSAR